MRAHHPRKAALALAVSLALPVLASAADGFVEDSSLSVVNRNFYFNQDYRNGDAFTNPNNGERQSLHA